MCFFHPWHWSCTPKQLVDFLSRKGHFSGPEEHWNHQQGIKFRFRSGRMRQIIHHQLFRDKFWLWFTSMYSQNRKSIQRTSETKYPKIPGTPKTLLFRIFRAPGGPESFACFMTTSSLLDKSRAKNAWSSEPTVFGIVHLFGFPVNLFLICSWRKEGKHPNHVGTEKKGGQNHSSQCARWFNVTFWSPTWGHLTFERVT